MDLDNVYCVRFWITLAPKVDVLHEPMVSNRQPVDGSEHRRAAGFVVQGDLKLGDVIVVSHEAVEMAIAECDIHDRIPVKPPCGPPTLWAAKPADHDLMLVGDGGEDTTAGGGRLGEDYLPRDNAPSLIRGERHLGTEEDVRDAERRLVGDPTTGVTTDETPPTIGLQARGERAAGLPHCLRGSRRASSRPRRRAGRGAAQGGGCMDTTTRTPRRSGR